MAARVRRAYRPSRARPCDAATLRRRLRSMPALEKKGLWGVQERAILNLEQSLAKDHPRALVLIASGSGKTLTAVSEIYRLIKFANAKCVLFLVHRDNLGRQALKEFQQYETPDDGRKFAELYNVQLLTSNKIAPVSKVIITPIQRLYSILRGEPDLPDPDAKERSSFDEAANARIGLKASEGGLGSENGQAGACVI